MAEMTHEYSQFPDKIWERRYFKDADDGIATIINQIKNLQSQGLYNQAQRIVEQNKDVLGKYIVDSEYLNAIDEELINLEIYSKQQQQSIYIQSEEPENAMLGAVWISD